MTEVFTTRSRGLVGGPRPTWFPAGSWAAVRDLDGAHPHLRCPGLAGPPGGPARRRTPHRRGRLLRTAGLLDLGARRRRAGPLTVQQVDDGEVSPYLVEGWSSATSSRSAAPSAAGSSGRRPEAPVEQPVLLVGGGSGVVPLMAMVRQRAALRQPGAVPAGVLRARPRPGDVRRRARPSRAAEDGCRGRPALHPRGTEGFARAAGRITADDLATPVGWAAGRSPAPTCAARPASSSTSSAGSWSSATPTARSAQNASEPEETAMT